MSERNNRRFILLLMGMLYIFQFWLAIPLKSEVIEIKKPTHFECQPKTLKLVKRIPMDFGEKEFFVNPTGFVFDSKNHCYVFDKVTLTLYVFDTDFKYVRKWVGKKGQGPGDLGNAKGIWSNMFVDSKDMIYLADPANRKIMVLNNQFKLIKEVFLKSDRYTDFMPIKDSGGNFYLYSRNGGIVDKIDDKGKIQYTYLSDAHLYKFLGWQPTNSKKIEKIFGNKLESPNWINTNYYLLQDGRLLIYMSSSSTFYIFKGETLQKKFNFWPLMAVERYEEKVKKLTKKNKAVQFYSSMLQQPAFDQDSKECIYLHSIYSDRDYNLIYKVSANGDLVDVLKMPKNLGAVVVAKKNGLFYCRGREEWTILKL